MTTDPKPNESGPTITDAAMAMAKRNVTRWRDGSDGEIPKEWALGLIARLERAEAERDALKEEKAVFVDMLSRKYDVMSWFLDDGWICLMKQDGALVEFKIDPATFTPVGPSGNSSRQIQNQRCLIVPAKRLEGLEAERDALKVVVGEAAMMLRDYEKILNKECPITWTCCSGACGVCPRCRLAAFLKKHEAALAAGSGAKS